MKRFLLIALCMMTVATASAQFMNVSSKPKTGHSSSILTGAPSDGYNRLNVGYSGTTMKEFYDGHDAYEPSTYKSKGAKLEYLRGINLKAGLPLFIEVGGAVDFGTCNMLDYEYDYEYDDDDDDDYDRLHMLSINVPINLTYRFQLAKNFVLAPYVGLRLRGNVMMKEKYQGKTSFYSGRSYYTIKTDNTRNWLTDNVKCTYVYDGTKETETWGDGDDKAKWFMVGMQCGVNAIIGKRFTLGVEYHDYFCKLYKENCDDDPLLIGLKGWSINVGVTF